LPIGYVYDGGSKDAGKLIHNIPVLGDLSYLKSVDFKEVLLVAAVGRHVWRRKMVEEAKKLGSKLMSIIHPTLSENDILDIVEAVKKLWLLPSNDRRRVYLFS